jgi:magnesium transporter
VTTETPSPQPPPVGPQGSGGVRSVLCTEHGALHPDLPIDDIDAFLADESNLLWLDIDLSRTPDLSVLTREFDFHELSLEDAVRHRQRPKIDHYPDYHFIVFYSVDASSPVDDLQLCQISMFVGKNYLVTVHDGRLAEIEESARHWRENIDKINRTVGVLLYSLLDTLVDGYFPVIDRVVDAVEDVEEAIFERYSQDALQQIFRLKKSLLNLRRVVAPERDVLNVLIRRDAPLFGAESYAYFQDVYDHLVRVSDSIDIYRDLLSSALDSYMSVTSNRLNEIMRTLTGWSIPLMTGALFAGIWGMNFEYMPELQWRLGYALALTVIWSSVLGIAIFLRRRRWL